MELRKVAVILLTFIIVGLATFTVSYHYSKPMGIYVVNKDNIQHTITLKLYRNNICIYSKTFKIPPNKAEVLKNVVVTSGNYVLNVTLDNVSRSVIALNNVKSVRIQISNSTLKIVSGS